MRQLFVPSRRVGITLFSLLLGGFILNFFMQAASLGLNIVSVLNWISQYYWLYLSGSLFFFFVLLVCAMIIPNVYTGALIAFLVCVVLGIANYEKLSTTGEPLFPWDLMQIKNAQEMTKITKGMISPAAVIVAVLLVAVLIYLMLKLPKVKVRLPLRITLGIISLVAVGGFIQMVGGQHALATSLKYQNIPWNQKVNYAQNGFVYAFAGNLMQNLIEKPEGYSKEAIEAIAQKYGTSTDTSPSKAVEQPNIMYMMDEAFFDPTRMPSFTFSEDPLKFIHQNAQSTPDGFLLSPEFGGNTANVEFEALTGLSMYFLKDGSIPYQQRIVKMSSLPSIVSILKERGYEALALHPFDDTFYNRNRVYPILGFDQFTSEKDLPNAKRYTPNGYISDMAAVQEAVRELKSASKPTFLHLVTMQNHFPFTKGLNGPNTITVSGVKPEYKDELETYTHDTKLTDEAVAYLSQQLKTIQRPTIVAFWGDHLPALSSGVYAQAGFNDNPRLKHETKLIYLANFDIGSKSPGTMSPAFIGPTVFELSGQSMPAYYKLLEKVKSEIPGLNKSVFIGKDNAVISALSPEQQSLLNDYKLVVYDMLEGEQYGKDVLY
ncbi:phosphoglycerol transferase MdoB-like AlkP superfamily enzyme [Paenibacillus rhizosphaerae]|uniref:Phosphoglycerol transferase MdoB-like AlkP superfamily enzyme n=1 Tax=Paenibacillus rhizosphaerae TaxID=297318 RepID=A0A839TIE0_9BACL|nr:alkaline phosphatase family protein [Paenibacillus rhizosphaerae]MBB3126454.1 phosphoglycerol transferase MdoB-like AlkP superfamily enzyme [Paenibacillus rhizosphaerae]